MVEVLRGDAPVLVIGLGRFGAACAGELDRLDRELPGASGRIRFFDMPRIDISSTLIRRRVAAGEPVRYLVPDAVAASIEREGLYR